MPVQNVPMAHATAEMWELSVGIALEGLQEQVSRPDQLALGATLK